MRFMVFETRLHGKPNRPNPVLLPQRVGSIFSQDGSPSLRILKRVRLAGWIRPPQLSG
jgi:hypothetical protein